MRSTKGTFQFLGTGGTTGVPVIGCDCAVCQSTDLKNKRWRSSGLIQVNGLNLLIDVGPDFRAQALQYQIHRLDALLLTHTHYDHIAGIDELRVYYFQTQKPTLCVASEETFEDLKKRYFYLFRPIGDAPTVSAQLQFTLLEEDQGAIELLGVSVQYISYFQGNTKVTGFRVGDFAYITDIRDFDPSIFVALRGVKKLALSAPRTEQSLIHLSLEEAIAFAKQVGAEETRFTHLSHLMDHESINATLPSGMGLAYDGLEMEFTLS